MGVAVAMGALAFCAVQVRNACGSRGTVVAESMSSFTASKVGVSVG